MATEIDQLTVSVAADTRPFETSLRDLGREADGFSTAISRAFKDAVAGGKSFESVLSSLALKLAGLALDKALQPVTSRHRRRHRCAVQGASAWPTAALSRAARCSRSPRAASSRQPTLFPLARGLGLMGEAGAGGGAAAGARQPTARSASARRGRRRRSPSTFNVTDRPTPTSFRKSEAQVTAMLAPRRRRAGQSRGL